MEIVTDWTALWDELVRAQRASERLRQKSEQEEDDPWHKRAAEFEESSKRRASKPDPLKDLLASQLEPSDTLLDIGAGTGRWVMRLAPLVSQVTALDPSPAMLGFLSQNVAAAGIRNVRVVQGSWPEAQIESHDVVLCAHAAYGSEDLPRFIARMTEVTRRTCYLALRCPYPDGVMAQAARHVWGQPHDSPNFVIAYNVLLGMGLCPNVVFDTTTWAPWSHASLEEALAEVKRRLGLSASETQHDEHLARLLASRLEPRDGRYYWPEGTRSALAYWNV